MTSFSEFYCDDCDRAFSTRFWLRQHLSGRPHAAIIAQKTDKDLRKPETAPIIKQEPVAAEEDDSSTPPPEYAQSPPPPLVRTSRRKQQHPVKRRMIEYVDIDGTTSRHTVESAQLPRLVDLMRARDEPPNNTKESATAETQPEPQPAATISIYYAADCACSVKGRKAKITDAGDMLALYHLCDNCVAVNKRVKLVI